MSLFFGKECVGLMSGILAVEYPDRCPADIRHVGPSIINVLVLRIVILSKSVKLRLTNTDALISASF